MKYANSLFAQKRYDEAITVLKRANLVSCHPNIYNLLGQCYQASGNFVDAEKCYKVSTQLLPIRIYLTIYWLNFMQNHLSSMKRK